MPSTRQQHHRPHRCATSDRRDSYKSWLNAYNYLCHMYEANFKTNVKTHAQKRIVQLFKLWFIEANGVKPSSRHMKVLKNAATFMFKRKSTVPRNPYLTQRLMMYMPPQIVANSYERGFMNELRNASNWFRMVPLYLRIQSDIDQYHATCRAADEPIHIGNFHVVPLHNSKTKYIRIDSATLKLMLQHLKIHPTKPSLNRPNKQVCLTNAEFNNAMDPTGTFNPNWFNYFKWSAVKKMQRHKKFDYQFLTDGVAVSLQFIDDRPPESETFEKVMEKQEIKYREFGQRFKNNEVQTIIGIDPGYKLYLAAVSKDMETNVETLFRLTSRKFYNMCQENIRDRKAKRYTSQLETEMAHYREENFGGTIASPMSATNYMLFIDHRLKHFNNCIALYTQNKYTELAFHKYVHTQKAMDGIVNELLPPNRSHERSLLVIGGTEFNPSAPIKKYRRCPGVRKKTHCDIVYADEYNTSQVCGRCQRRFKTSDDETIQHKRWERKGVRMRMCSNCTPNANIIPLPTTINTKMSSRAQHLHRLAITNRLFFNVTAYSMEDAKRESDNIHYIAENCCYDVSIPKHKFDPNDRTTQLKCIWNRDISGARNILFKGVARISGIPAPKALSRQNLNEDESSDESID